MNLAKTSMLSTLTTALKVVIQSLISKVTAMYLGRSGLAIVGNFTNIYNILCSISTLSINSGITKRVAEEGHNPSERLKVKKTSLMIVTITSLILSIILFCFSSYLAKKLLGSEGYHVVFKVLSITMVFNALCFWLLSIINGLKEVKIYIWSQVLVDLVFLVVSYALIKNFSLIGALVSITMFHGISFFILFSYAKYKKIINFEGIQKAKADFHHAKKFLPFAMMSLFTMLTGPMIQIQIRSLITKYMTLDMAGYWEGINRVSGIYLMLFTTALGAYYFPKLSETNCKDDLRREVIACYKLLIPLVVSITIGIFIFREKILLLLYTPEFLQASYLFKYQLVGDVLKIATWVLSYLFLAKAMTKHYIVSEIIYITAYVALNTILIKNYGALGATMAHMFSYFIYFMLMLFIFRKLLFFRNREV